MRFKGLTYQSGLRNALPGFLVFLLYFILIIIWAQPRWLYTDSAYLIFRILNQEPLFFDRFANEIQMLPAQLTVSLGMPAGVVLFLLNCTLPLLYFFAWLWYRKKDEERALIFPLLLICSGYEMFFLGFSEIHTAALALGILLQIKNQKPRIQSYIFIAGWLLFMLFSHPAAWLFVPFVFLYYLYTPNLKKASVFVPLTCLIYVAIKSIWRPDSNPYDTGLIANLTNLTTWQKLPELYSTHYFYSAVVSWLLPALLVFFTVVFLLIFKYKSRVAAFLYLAYTICACLITLVIYQQGEAAVLMEKFFYPLAAMLVLPMFLIVKKPNTIVYVSFILIALFYFKGVFHKRHFYLQRFAKLETIHAHYISKPGQKFILNQAHFAPDTFGSTWALPYESMVYSVLHHKKTLNIKAINLKDLNTDRYKNTDSLYHGADFVPPFPIRTLNKKYFQLPRTFYAVDSL